MSFLCTHDYNALIQSAVAEMVTDAATRDRAEKFAIDEINSYLSALFNMTEAFKYNAFNHTANDSIITRDFAVDEIAVLTDGTAYVCILAATTGEDLTDTTYFTKSDPRNQLLIMIMIDIAIYHYHARIDQEQVPQIRFDRYDKAIKDLEKIQKGTKQIALPELDPEVAKGGWSSWTQEKRVTEW